MKLTLKISPPPFISVHSEVPQVCTHRSAPSLSSPVLIGAFAKFLETITSFVICVCLSICPSTQFKFDEFS